MRRRSVNAFLIGLVLLLILVAVILTQCRPGATPAQTTPLPTVESPTNTPVPTLTVPMPGECEPIAASNDTGLAVLAMPDGSEIYLGERTMLTFIPGGYCTGRPETQVLLRDGEVAIHAVANRISVSNSRGFTAILDQTGLVRFSPTTGVFELGCTNGNCGIGPDADHLVSLTCGQSASLDAYNTLSGPSPMILAPLLVFGDWLYPKCLPAMTDTPLPPTPEIDQAATATAGCIEFHRRFRLTPCPTLRP